MTSAELSPNFQDLLENLPDSLALPLKTAYHLAQSAHANQKRRQGTPYIDHPLEVALLLKNVFSVTSPHLLSAALLHDCLEDTALTVDYLLKFVSPRTLELIVLVTDPKSKMTSDERKFHYLTIWNDPEATLLKISDRLANLKDLLVDGSPSFARHYIKRTCNEMLQPGLVSFENLWFRSLLESALLPCEKLANSKTLS